MGVSNNQVVHILHKQYPQLGAEMVQNLSKNAPILKKLSLIPSVIPHVLSAVSSYSTRERKTLFVGIMLLLFDPNSIHFHVPMSKRNGLRHAMAKELDLTPSSISKQVSKARDFYKTYKWYRETAHKVSEIIKREYGK